MCAELIYAHSICLVINLGAYTWKLESYRSKKYHASYVPHLVHPHGFWWWNQLYLSCYKIYISNKCTSGTMSNCIKLQRTLLLTSWTLSIDYFLHLKRFRDWTRPSSLHKMSIQLGSIVTASPFRQGISTCGWRHSPFSETLF